MIRQNLFDDQVAIVISETRDGNMRFLGMSDEREAIANQAKLGEALRLTNDKIARVKTTYNGFESFVDYLEITTENLHAQSVDNFETQIPLADGLVTKNPEIGLLLPLADCLGVVVFDTAQKIVGLLHAGRHNIEQNGPQKFIEFFVNRCGSNPKNLQLYYSPHALDYRIFKLDNKTLAEAATEQFVAAGILPENITNPKIDTVTSTNFPSYSDGDKTERFAVAVRLTEVGRN